MYVIKVSVIILFLSLWRVISSKIAILMNHTRPSSHVKVWKRLEEWGTKREFLHNGATAANIRNVSEYLSSCTACMSISRREGLATAIYNNCVRQGIIFILTPFFTDFDKNILELMTNVLNELFYKKILYVLYRKNVLHWLWNNWYFVRNKTIRTVLY